MRSYVWDVYALWDLHSQVTIIYFMLIALFLRIDGACFDEKYLEYCINACAKFPTGSVLN